MIKKCLLDCWLAADSLEAQGRLPHPFSDTRHGIKVIQALHTWEAGATINNKQLQRTAFTATRTGHLASRKRTVTGNLLSFAASGSAVC
jgi:hypothetical protein